MLCALCADPHTRDGFRTTDVLEAFMRYVRANDDTARGAIEKMAEGLRPSGQPLSAPATSLLRVVASRETGS